MTDGQAGPEVLFQSDDSVTLWKSEDSLLSPIPTNQRIEPDLITSEIYAFAVRLFGMFGAWFLFPHA